MCIAQDHGRQSLSFNIYTAATAYDNAKISLSKTIPQHESIQRTGSRALWEVATHLHSTIPITLSDNRSVHNRIRRNGDPPTVTSWTSSLFWRNHWSPLLLNLFIFLLFFVQKTTKNLSKNPSHFSIVPYTLSVENGIPLQNFSFEDSQWRKNPEKEKSITHSHLILRLKPRQRLHSKVSYTDHQIQIRPTPQQKDSLKHILIPRNTTAKCHTQSKTIHKVPKKILTQNRHLVPNIGFTRNPKSYPQHPHHQTPRSPILQNPTSPPAASIFDLSGTILDPKTRKFVSKVPRYESSWWEVYAAKLSKIRQLQGVKPGGHDNRWLASSGAPEGDHACDWRYRRDSLARSLASWVVGNGIPSGIGFVRGSSERNKILLAHVQIIYKTWEKTWVSYWTLLKRRFSWVSFF